MATTSSFSFLSEIDPNARAVAAQAEALLHVDPPACIDGAQVDVLAGASRQDGVVPLSMNERHCIEREASETKTPKKGCRERGEME